MYRAIFENSQDAILLTSPDGTTHQANAAACEMLGLTEDEIRSRPRFQIMNTNDPGYIRMLQERERTGRTSGETTMLRGDGTIFPVELSSSLFRDRDGNIRGVVISGTKTERKRSEEELREKETQYRNLADSGLALIWTSGVDKLCNYFNEPWLNFTGRTLERSLQWLG
jgi:PAS domain S-box-containing protein